MSNPFVNWTQDMVDAHNRKVVKSEGKAHISELPVTPTVQSKAIPNACTSEKLNKLEREFHGWLKDNHYTHIHVQSVTLKIGDDCRYTPDFVTVDQWGNIRFWEAKGFFRDDAKVKIKVAARMYRHMGEFWLVFKKEGQFEFEYVKP